MGSEAWDREGSKAIRKRICETLEARDRALSVQELSELLEKPLSLMAYQLKVLTQEKAVTLARMEPVGGSVTDFYEIASAAA